MVNDAPEMPLYFPGRKVNKRTLNAVLSAPPRLWVAPVDIFLSTVRPYWENERDPAKKVGTPDRACAPA